MSDIQMALLFPFMPVLILLLIYYASGADIDDDDDQGGGKGMLQPIYAPAPTS